MGLHTAGGSVATWAWTKQKRLSEATCAAAATRDSQRGRGVSVSLRGRQVNEQRALAASRREMEDKL